MGAGKINNQHNEIMPELITASIDVTKIDKKRLFKGQKGIYLNIILIPTKDNQFGDWMICESVSKEEKAQGIRGAILGNAKKAVRGGQQQQAAPQNNDDVPF